MAEQKFDTIGFILAYESGEGMKTEDVIAGFQHLINTGMAWTLQGSYGRTAAYLIDEGYCTDPRDALDPQEIEFEEAKRNG